MLADVRRQARAARPPGPGLGGEEFGLLLGEGSVETAIEVVERLRARVAAGRTCSAGIAIRRAGEAIDGVVARADHALYQAKAAGRDRVHVNAEEIAPGTSGEVHSLDASY